MFFEVEIKELHFHSQTCVYWANTQQKLTKKEILGFLLDALLEYS